MNPIRFSSPRRDRQSFAARWCRISRGLLLVVALLGLSRGVAFSQGVFYPVNPPGLPASAHYTGTPYVNTSIQGATYNELGYIESFLHSSGLTLRFPVPAGYTLATDAQLSTAVASAAQQIIQNPGLAPAGVTLTTLAREMVSNRPTDAVSVVNVIAQAIVQFSSSSTVAISNLDSLLSTLGAVYPASFTSYSGAILTQAATTTATVSGIPLLTLTATLAARSNDQYVGIIVGQTFSAILGSSLNSSAKQSLLESVISTQLGSSQINNSAALIGSVVAQTALFLHSPDTLSNEAALSTVLNTALSTLQSAGLANNASVGAVVAGALVADSVNATLIASDLASANSATATYTNAVVAGYIAAYPSGPVSAEQNYQAALAANPNLADAIVTGAATRGVVGPTVLITDALSAVGTATVQNITGAAISADLVFSDSVNVPNHSAVMVGAAVLLNPTGANFQGIAFGAASAARLADLGSITFTMIAGSAGYTQPFSGSGTLVPSSVQVVVNGVITAAYATGKQAALADIVYNAEQAAYHSPATLSTAVSQAITTMKPLDPGSTYIAAAAALAGYGGNSPVTDLSTIASAAHSADGNASGPVFDAIDAASHFMVSARATTGGAGVVGTAVSTAMTMFGTASASDSVLSVLYAASLSDPSQSSAMLAAAICKASALTPVAQLLSAAENANPSKQAALAVASAVAAHIQANIANQTNTDLLDFVGYQAAQNPAYILDIASAATIADPIHATYIAHALSFNAPSVFLTAVSPLLGYSQLTTLTNPENGLLIEPVDASAAISAAFTIGVLETRGSATVTDAQVQASLVSFVSTEAVIVARLSGATMSQMSLGGTVVNTRSLGAAGVITGFISQVVQPGDTTIGRTGTGGNSILSTAAIQAVLASVGTAPGASVYSLQMAQAAGQALRSIAGSSVVAAPYNGSANGAAYDIALPLSGSGLSFQAIQNAAYYGITQGAAGVPGAGAIGVSANGSLYSQRDATGTPVSDITSIYGISMGITGSGGSTGTTTSTQPPVVEFTAPASAVLTASVVDSLGTVSGVDFYEGGTYLGTSTTAPYTFNLNALASNGLATGTYPVSAVAHDNTGRTASATGTIVVDAPPGVNPVVTIASGNNQLGSQGSFLAQALTVAVTYPSGAPWPGVSVAFNVAAGGGGISTTNSGATQSSLSVATNAAGQAQVYFKLPSADTGNDQITASVSGETPVIFSEAALPSPPQVTLQIAGNTLPPAAPILTATVASVLPVSKVDFYEGQQFLGSFTASPYVLSLQNVTAGIHSYTAIATNSIGTGQATTNFTVAVPADPFVQYRYTRGFGADPSFQTFVIALNQTVGAPLDAMGNNAGNFPGRTPWFTQVANATAYHVAVSATSVDGLPSDSTTYPGTQAFQNPVVAFGAGGGGNPLYVNQSYSFGFGSGGQDPSMTSLQDLRIRVFSKSSFGAGQSNVAPVATFTFSLPRQNTADWTSFAQDGFQRTYALTAGGVTYPMVTTFRFEASQQGTPQFGSGSASPFILTHISSSDAYYYEIDYQGVAVAPLVTDSGGHETISAQEFWMASPISNTTANSYTVGNSSGSFSLGYTLDFTPLPQQVSTIITRPQFQGQPLPSAYEGMSTADLLKVSNPLTYQFSTLNTSDPSLTALDASPELRLHPTLDKFVADMGSNPMVLANYVINSIQLTDALSYNRNGDVSTASINCGGVNRGALGTFMEKQGNPIEQCSLLVYFLRKCNVPCGYVFPSNNSLQMLDERMSSILRMQLHNAVDVNGNPIMPQIIPVNYPWVAAYINGAWIHIFPWMKDTAISEGYDLNPLMPVGYQSGLQWMQLYVARDPNIMSLSTQWDDPGHLFVPFVQKSLAQNHPEISLNDVGIQAWDRQDNFNSWAQFPQPWGLSGSLTAANFQSSLGLTPNIFNTVDIKIHTYGNGSLPATTLFDTGTLRVLDLHNRRLMVQEVKNASDSNYTLSLSLAPFKPGTTTVGNFSSSSDMVNKQVLSSSTIPVGDVIFDIQASYVRNLNLPSGFTQPQYSWGAYLGVNDELSYTSTNLFFSGDLITYCLDLGRVTQEMLDVHAQNYWNAQQAVAANPGASIDPDDLSGEPVYMMGMTYYKRCDDFRRDVGALYKDNLISIIGYGISKVRAQRDPNGALPGGAITLLYPGFDMNRNEVAHASYDAAHADTTTPYTQDSLYLRLAGDSANEHTTINTFFNLTDSASTIHLLDVAEENGTPPLFLTSQNYLTLGATPITVDVAGTNTTQALSVWAGSEWANLVANFESSNYAFAYVTPGPITSANGTYSGMAYLLADGYGDTSSLLAQNQQQIPINGGEGALPAAYAISAATAPNYELIMDGDGSGSYNLRGSSASGGVYFFTGIPANVDVGYVLNQISSGNYAVSDWGANAFNNDGVRLGVRAPGSSPPTSASDKAALVKNIGNTGVYKYPKDQSQRTPIADPVDVVDGSFYVGDTDLNVSGPIPIQLRRYYDSSNQTTNEFGFGWQMNYEPFLSVATGNAVIYATEADGSVIAYRQQTGSTTLWSPLAADNPSLVNHRGNLSGGFNLFLNYLQLGTDGKYSLFGADGSVRTYAVASYPIGGSGGLTRTRPYLTSWKDAQGNALTFTIGSNSALNDYGMLSRITGPNGNYIQLDYDAFGHIVSANSGDGRIVSYAYDNYGDLTGVTRTDGSQVSYTYDHPTQVVSGANLPYSDHLLLQVTKPEGRLLVNTYDTNGRVTQQKATVGPNATLAINGTFTYVNAVNGDGTISGYTNVTDAFGNTTRYDYDSNNIKVITDPAPLNTTIHQTWYATSNGTGGYQRSLQQRIDKRSLTQNFTYDANGNVTQIDTVGDITGSGASATHTTTASYNAQNLPVSLVDQSNHNSTAFAYTSPISPYLVTLVTNSTPAGEVSETAYSYGNVAGGAANGVLLELTAGRGPGGATNGAVTDFTYNAQGYVASETLRSGSADPDVTYTFSYNASGQLTQKTDAAGRSTQISYDRLGNAASEMVYDENGTLISFHFNYFNQNGELEWTQGPRFYPDDYAYRQYDGGGRLTQFLKYCSAAIPDGSGVQQSEGQNLVAATSNQYDLFGNLTFTMDPNGNTTQMTYDPIGRVLTKGYFDATNAAMASESFTYEAGDQVATQTDARGGVTQYFYTQTGQLRKQINPDGSIYQWLYQLDGRLHEVIYPNAATLVMTYDDFARSIVSVKTSGALIASETALYDLRGNLISWTDAEQNTFTKTYDLLDRVKTANGPAATASSALQQVSEVYDAAGIVHTSTNALGEQTVTTSDALGRPVLLRTNAANGTLVNQTSYLYSPDHQSVTVTSGAGAGGVSETVYTNTFGQTVLVKHADGKFKLSTYDPVGNLLATDNELGDVTSFTYDGLNRVVSQSLPADSVAGEATTHFVYDDAGDLLQRQMPGGAAHVMTYDNAGHKLTESLTNGANVTRQFGYSYYGAGDPAVGKLNTITDPRGFGATWTYDGFLRPASITSTGSAVAQQNQTTTFSYNLRNLIQQISQNYAVGSTGPPTVVNRSYDAYRQLTAETVFLSGNTVSQWSQTWDSAGRRTGLASQLTAQGVGAGLNYGFQYQADGLLTQVSNAGQNYGFNYGSTGLLQSRVNSSRTQTMGYDSRGRPLSTSNTLGGSVTPLSETMAWREDPKLATYTANRTGSGVWDETRDYAYNGRGQLQSEPFAPGAGQSAAFSYQFDGNTQSGPGVRTQAQVSADTLDLVTTVNPLLQVTGETQAPGDGSSAAITWSYDAAGNVLSRTSSTQPAKSFVWDSFGRLVDVETLDGSNNGSSWTAVYDGLGRRIQSTNVPVSAGSPETSQTTTVTSFYDPEVEFLELGISVNGTRTWKVYGPDANGGYGSLQGTGGLEATVDETSGTVTSIINDAFGNAVASVVGGSVSWNPAQVGSYGLLPGSDAGLVESGATLAQATVWRGHREDASGFYYLGARYYDPESGRFLSPDPMGHVASMSLYDYCDGDPVNSLDPDGRLSSMKEGTPRNPYSNGDHLGEVAAFTNPYPNETIGADIEYGYITAVAGGVVQLSSEVDRGVGLYMHDPQRLRLASQEANALPNLVKTLGANPYSNASAFTQLGIIASPFLLKGAGLAIEEMMPTIRAGALFLTLLTSDIVDVPTAPAPTEFAAKTGPLVQGEFDFVRDDLSGKLSDWTPTQTSLHRPYIRNWVVDAVEAAAPRAPDGRFIDPNTLLPTDNPVLGHKFGYEFWRLRDAAQAAGVSQYWFNETLNNPEFYQIEDMTSNASHLFEQK